MAKTVTCGPGATTGFAWTSRWNALACLVPRAGLPDDIAHAAVLLASDESSFRQRPRPVVDSAITGERNWTQQQQRYVALRKAFEQGGG
jgi:hypothetical protein